MPKISIIVPVYNSQSTLLRCVNSLLAQTQPNIEIILIDDGSTDDSIILCKNLKEEHPNQIVFISKKNAGAASARNSGLDIATGDFVCFVDSDDYCEPEYCEILYNTLLEHNADCSMCAIYTIEVKENKKEEIYIFPTDYFSNVRTDIRNLQAGCFNNKIANFSTDIIGMGTPWDKLFKMDIIRTNNLRFNTKLKTGEDTVFCFNYFTFVKTFVYTHKPLYNYFITTTSLSRRFVSMEDFYNNESYFFEILLRKDEIKNDETLTQSVNYAIFRHFKSLLKKHFASSQNNNSLWKNYIELRNTINSKYIKQSKRNIQKRLLSMTELLLLVLMHFPFFLATAIYIFYSNGKNKNF